MTGSQAGLFAGHNPLQYNASNPIILFLIQVIVILLTCHLVHLPLSRLRQPRVVSEVVAGIILGPSVLGHIPGYMDSLFPREGMAVFTNTSTLGLVFLLFLVGLETDLSVVRRHVRPAVAVSLCGVCVPFGMGVALAMGLWREFEGESEAEFGVFVLFVGLAMAITAFPVLARILLETDLLSSPVGLIALAAGVANDVIGWTLLALCVTLTQAQSGAVAAYMVLCCLAWILLMVFAARPLLLRVLKTSLTEASQPTERDFAVILLLVLISSLFTALIDVHPIFGAFIVGAIVPKTGGFDKKVLDKISTLVYNVLLPPFFALSGINTNISSLSSGVAWGYVFAVTSLAFVGKAAASFIGAKLCRIRTRESVTIGILMSCKGIVELIALNIGLQAKVISEQTFTIFVVMAIILTGVTQPLVLWLFPSRLRDSDGHIYTKREDGTDSETTSHSDSVKGPSSTVQEV